MYENVRRGEYDVNGRVMYFRSSWEYAFACYLDFLKNKGEIKDWHFESQVFVFDGIRHGTTRYIPDFEVIENDGRIVFYEVKGHMDSRSKTKLKRMAKYHKDVKLILIEKDFIANLKKQAKLLNIKE